MSYLEILFFDDSIADLHERAISSDDVERNVGELLFHVVHEFMATAGDQNQTIAVLNPFFQKTAIFSRNHLDLAFGEE